MKRTMLFALCAMLFALCAIAPASRAASNVTFTWDAAAASDLAGYRLYQSATSGSYNKTTGKVCDVLAPVTTCTISGLPDGVYYWVATAYDKSGNESAYSNEVTRAFDSTAPAAPGNLKITIAVTVTVAP
jgi:fibronectin type 3 domain-containing protein